MPEFHLGDVKIPEPKPGGDLFKAEEDYWHNAVLDTYRPSWYVYAEGYRRAAHALVKKVMGDKLSEDMDWLVYPILFLYRQYLELSLKMLIYDSERFLEQPVRARNTHNLAHLWAECQTLLQKVAEQVAEEPSLTENLDVIENCIQQFSKTDPTSEAFRYPVRKDGSPVEHPVTRVNVRNLADEMSNAAEVIDSASNYITILSDQEAEFESEYGP